MKVSTLPGTARSLRIEPKLSRLTFRSPWNDKKFRAIRAALRKLSPALVAHQLRLKRFRLPAMNETPKEDQNLFPVECKFRLKSFTDN
jgi:hypothetical protein